MSQELPRLQAIVDVDTAAAVAWRAEDLVGAFLEGGATFIQIRAKKLASGAFLELCDAAVRLAEPYRAAIIVNDRVDLAAMSGAAGVHVGQDDLPPAAARSLVGREAIVGYSTHTVSQIDRARAEPLTYVAVGPVFGTRTKATGFDAVGLELVAEAARSAAGRPIVAIGGITLDTAPAVIHAGAACAAVISDLLVDRDPAKRVRLFIDVLNGAR